MSSSCKLLIIWFTFCLRSSFCWTSPVQGIIQDICLLSEYLSGDSTCLQCPTNCEKCYLKNHEVICSTCAESYFFNSNPAIQNQNCVDSCPEGYKSDSSDRQCIQCSVRFCADCSNEASISCSKCSDGYEYDISSQLCVKNCPGQLFDTLNGECVDQCSEDKMTYKQTCVSNVRCPQIGTIQNVCSMSSMIQVISISDGEKLIAIGATNINIFSLPYYLILQTHTLISAYQIIECKILSADSSNMYCSNTGSQIIKFSLSDLTETIQISSIAYFHGQDGTQYGYWEDNIIVANSQYFIEKIDILTSISQSIAIPSGLIKSIYSVSYWKDRDLVSTFFLTFSYSYSVLLFSPSTGLLKQIPIPKSSKLNQKTYLTGIDYNNVIIYNDYFYVYCQVSTGDITAASDFTITTSGSFSLYSSQDFIKVFKPQGIFIMSSSFRDIITVMDISISVYSIKKIVEYQQVTSYLVIDNYIFLTTSLSTIKILALTQTSTGITFSVTESFPLLNSPTIQILGIVFASSRIFLYNQYEIVSIDLIHEGSRTTADFASQALTDPHQVILNGSSKCQRNYSSEIHLNVYKEDTGFIIFVLEYSVIGSPIKHSSYYQPFEIILDTANGVISSSFYNTDYRKLVIIQHKMTTIIDLNTQEVVFLIDKFDNNLQYYFQDNSIFAYLGQTDQISSCLIVISLETLNTVNIDLTEGQLYFFPIITVQYFYYELDKIITKFNNHGEIIQTFPGYDYASYQYINYLDNDIQIIFDETSATVYDLIGQQIIAVIDIQPYSLVQQIFQQDNLTKGLFYYDVDLIILYDFPQSGEVTEMVYSCPGNETTLGFYTYFPDVQVASFISLSQNVLCVIDFESEEILYIENRYLFSINVGTFLSFEEAYLFSSRKGMTEIYLKKPLSENNSNFLIKVMDLEVYCDSIRQYDKNTGICLNKNSDEPVFFPLANRLSVDILPIEFEVLQMQNIDLFFILQGARVVAISTKSDLIFMHERSSQEVNNSTIKEVIFDLDTREIVIIWSEKIIEHIDTKTGEILNYLSDIQLFIAYSPNLKLVVYQLEEQMQNNSSIRLNFLNLKAKNVIFTLSFDKSNSPFQAVLDESGKVLFLLRENIIFRIDLITGRLIYQQIYLLQSTSIKYIIPTTSTLILIPTNLTFGLIIDITSLQIILTDSLVSMKIDGTDTSSDKDFSLEAVSSDKKYFILNIKYLQKIIVFRSADLQVLQAIQHYLAYIILDIDMDNQLICTLTTNQFILTYQYSLTSQDVTNAQPLYQINFSNYLIPTNMYYGISFLDRVSAKIFTKYQLLITSLDNLIRIHSLQDGLLRFLIQDDDLVITSFMLYLNNFLITYGNNEFRVFNIEHALFFKQNVTSSPFKFQQFLISIGNGDLLSNQELTQIGQEKFFMPFASSADDQNGNYQCQIGEKVNLVDDRYSIEISASVSLKSNNGQDISEEYSAWKLSSYESHKIYYISKASVLFGVQDSNIFRSISLSMEHSKLLTKYFFVSRSYVGFLKVDYIAVFSLDLTLVSQQIFDFPFISRVLAVPSEINADRFIFISTDSQILYFDLALNSTSLITPISGIRGQLSYYFFLASETHRVLVIGFSDQSVLTIDLDSFVGTWMEASASVPSQILSTVRRLFASKQFLYLVDDSKHINVFKFTISSTLNSLGLQESVISFAAVTKIDSMTIEQFFFDATKERLIFFINNSSYVHYAVLKSIILDQSSPSTVSYELSVTESPILKPSFDSSTLHINPTLDLYIFYGDVYILVIYATEMKMRALISDSSISSQITAVYALTNNILIVTTNTNIYSIVFLIPYNSQVSMYKISNSMELSFATVIFYRYQQPNNFSNIINVILEGVSLEGSFNIKYPINLLNTTSVMQCGVSFGFTQNQVSSQLFLTSLNEISKLNKNQELQTYQIDNFIMVFINGIDDFYKYLNEQYYDYFRMSGWSQDIILWIFPQSDFSVTTGNHFHLKQFSFMFLRFQSDILLLNKHFTQYITLIMEEIYFSTDNQGYYFTFQGITYVQFKTIVFSQLTFAQDSQRAPTSLFSASDRLLFETEYQLTEQILLEGSANTTFCTFWNATDLAELNKLTISSIVLHDFQSMFSFLDCNKAVVSSIQAVGIEMKQRFYENQQVMLFIKVTTVIIQDVLFQNVVLNDVSLMRFHDISNLTIVNLNFTNITCTAAASSTENPQFLLEFLGIQSLNIQGLYFQDIKNCFLVNAQQYKLENVLKSNSAFIFNNTILNDISFNNLAAVVSSNPSTLRQLTGESEEIKIATPSLLALTVTDLVIQNSNINDCNIKYTTLMNVASASIQIENVQIGNTHLTIPSSLTYPSPAISLACGTLIASKLSLVDNYQVDFALTATEEATFTELTVKGNSNSANNYKGDISGMVSISSTTSLNIVNSKFESNTGFKYSTGGLYLNTITRFLISDCTFLNNTSNSQAGGGLAIYYSDSGISSIINSIFKENKSPQHSGGGIYALTSDFQLEGCFFQDNSALIGGGIRISSNKYYDTFMDSFNSSLYLNTYQGNWASLYGNDVGLYPIKLINFKDLTSNFPIDFSQSTTQYYVNNFKSGDSLSNLWFTVLDNQRRSITFSNYSAVNTHQLVIDEISKFSFSWSANSTNNIFIPQGSISLNQVTSLFEVNLNLYITPSVTESIKIVSASTYPALDPLTFQFSLKPLSLEIIVASRLCEIGEIYQAINKVYQCFSCPEGKYSFSVPSLDNINTATCKICPPQALNCILNQMNLLNGYWRESEISDEIFQCSKSTMDCKAQETTSRELCGEGSIGPMCQSCDIYGRLWGESYSRFTDQSCIKCSKILVSYVILLILFGVVVTYILILVWQNCKAIEKKIKAITIIKLGLVRMGRSAIFDQFTTLQKIFMNYLLFIFILTEMDFSMPSNISLISIGGDPILNILHSIDCFLSNFEGMNIVYWRILWIFLFVHVIAIIITIIFLLSYILLLQKLKKASVLRLLKIKQKKILHQAESSIIPDRSHQHSSQVNPIRLKLKSQIDKQNNIFAEGVRELNEKSNNYNSMHINSNFEVSSCINGNNLPLSKKDIELQQQQIPYELKKPQLIASPLSKQTDSQLKGNIIALQGDDNPIEIDDIQFNQEDVLSDEIIDFKEENEKVKDHNLDKLSVNPYKSDQHEINDINQKQDLVGKMRRSPVFVKSQVEFLLSDEKPDSIFAKIGSPRTDSHHIEAENSYSMKPRKSFGLEVSTNVPYFKVKSKYFQWYSGYIWMSMKLLFFYMQPGIVKMLLSVLSCVKIGSKQYIYADAQFECGTEYRIISLTAILPVLLIFCFVVPSIMFRQLKIHQEEQTSYTFLKSYGFFFQEYKSKAYYWEIFRMVTKNMISCVLVFYSSSIALKLILTILIISFYIFMQLRVQPYKTRSFNELDYLSNAVVVMSLILGLLIYSTDIIWLRVIAGLSMFALNAVFIWKIFKESLLAITLPCRPEQRTFVHRILFFLHVRIPYIFGMMAVQKPFSCKIFIMWKKLSLYVHLHKDLLLQQSESQKNLEDAKSLLLSSLKLDSENELNLLENNTEEIRISHNILNPILPNNSNNLLAIQNNNQQKDNFSLQDFNEKMLDQLKKISTKLSNTFQKQTEVDLKSIGSECVQSIELISMQPQVNQAQPVVEDSLKYSVKSLQPIQEQSLSKKSPYSNHTKDPNEDHGSQSKATKKKLTQIKQLEGQQDSVLLEDEKLEVEIEEEKQTLEQKTIQNQQEVKYIKKETPKRRKNIQQSQPDKIWSKKISSKLKQRYFSQESKDFNQNSNPSNNTSLAQNHQSEGSEQVDFSPAYKKSNTNPIEIPKLFKSKSNSNSVQIDSAQITKTLQQINPLDSPNLHGHTLSSGHTLMQLNSPSQQSLSFDLNHNQNHQFPNMGYIQSQIQRNRQKAEQFINNSVHLLDKKISLKNSDKEKKAVKSLFNKESLSSLSSQHIESFVSFPHLTNHHTNSNDPNAESNPKLKSKALSPDRRQNTTDFTENNFQNRKANEMQWVSSKTFQRSKSLEGLSLLANLRSQDCTSFSSKKNTKNVELLNEQDHLMIDENVNQQEDKEGQMRSNALSKIEELKSQEEKNNQQKLSF